MAIAVNPANLSPKLIETQNQYIKYQQDIDDYLKKAVVTDVVEGGKRTYQIPDGSKYPSVTTILSAMEDKTWLREWKVRVGEEEAKRVTKKATSRGTSVHKLCEAHFRGETIDKESPGYSMFKQMRIYIDNIMPLGLEVPLWSNRLKVAGRTDCVGVYKNYGICIIDYKTSKNEKRAENITGYFQQSTIYSLMLLERLDIVAKKVIILVGTDSGFPQEFVRDVRDYIPQTLAIIKAYHNQFNVT